MTSKMIPRHNLNDHRSISGTFIFHDRQYSAKIGNISGVPVVARQRGEYHRNLR